MNKILLSLLLSVSCLYGASNSYRTVSPLDIPVTPRMFTTNVNINDGVFDATAAIQAAIDSLPISTYYQSHSGEVYLPPGTYKTTSPIKLYNGVTFGGAGKFATKIVNTTQSDVFKIIYSTNSVNSVVRIHDIHIEGVDGATNGTAINMDLDADVGMGNWAPWPIVERVKIWFCQDGISLSNTVCGEIKDVQVRSASRYGIVSRGSLNAVSMDRMYAINCGSHGFLMNAGNYNTLQNCASEYNGGDGYRWESADGLDDWVFASSMISCGAEHNTGNGATIYRSHGGSLINCYWGENGTNGLAVMGGYGLTMIGGWSVSNLGYGIFIGNDEDGGEAWGVILMGVPYLGNYTGEINDRSKVIRYETGYGRVVRYGSGEAHTGVDINYGSGGVGIGVTNINYHGFLHRSSNPELRLQYYNDTNYYADLKVNFASWKPVQLFGAYGSELLRQSAAYGEHLIALPLATPRGGSSGGLLVGYTNAWSALGVNGGIGVGCTNDPGTGSIVVNDSYTFIGGVAISSGAADPGALSKPNGSMYINTTTGGWFHRTNDTWIPK